MKIGDKIIIRTDLIVGETYGLHCFNSDMQEFAGQELEITAVVDDTDMDNNVIGQHYRVAGNDWDWTDLMFEN